uniref:Uncharacterized protein n=1 Tax=Lotharella oceanica TaxID=641309 RepID=A0A7S2TMC3_9EUKA|eukprot:CAMPEP_0170177042 /NCGR_PEP_ID=MMETSP0040_2-20121228/9773_1 /TAXON_ID=641309 /ORGANISM="Lotharella oceanica, Strain CCMP622" /LENGTH=182 /DNA_ID=CAMNT_0010419545 /DNA_START=38 /DNA_END=586 /DNA_ORIENTATION=-
MQPRLQSKTDMFERNSSSTADLPPRAPQLRPASRFSRNYGKGERKMLKSARTFDAGRIMMQPPPLSVKMHSSSDASVRQKVSLKRSIGQQVAKMMQWGDDILDIANTMNTESEKKRRTDEPSKNGEKDEKSRAAHFREAYSCPFLPGLYDENNPIDEDLRETSMKPEAITEKAQLQAVALRS